MSLELALAENTAAMRQLIELLKVSTPIEAPKPAKKAKKEPEPAEAPKAAEPAPKAAEPKAEASKAFDFKTLADTTARLAAKDRKRAIDILAGFGVKRASELKPEQFADALEQMQAALQ